MSCLLQLTKCPTEHARKASSLESIAAGSWEAAIDEVVQAAIRDASHHEQHSVNPGSVPPEDGLGFYSSDGLGLGLSGRGTSGLSPGEVVAAPQPAVESSLKHLCHLILPCSQQHPPLLGAQPGTPVPDVFLQASQTSRPSSSAPSLRSTTLARARQFDDDARGQKRAAEDVPTLGRVSPTGGGEHSQASEVPVRADGS